MLTDAIANDVKDPRVRAATLITVAKVELNVDMSVANVYVSIVGDDATADGVIAGLSKAAGFLRGPVGRELDLQRAPELRFMHDVSLDISAKLARDRARGRGARAGGGPRSGADAAGRGHRRRRGTVDAEAIVDAEAEAEGPEPDERRDPSRRDDAERDRDRVHLGRVDRAGHRARVRRAARRRSGSC